MKSRITLICVLFPIILLSQNFNPNYNPDYNPISTSTPFLSHSYDARGVGIGNTGSATAADINSMYWNPAKYAFITEDQKENVVDYPKDMGFSLAYNRGYSIFLKDDIHLNFNSYKAFGKQTIATSVNYYNWDNIMLSDEEGNPLGQMKPFEFSVDVAYARRLSESFSIAGVLRYIHSELFNGYYIQGIEVKTGRALAGDLALLYRKKINIAAFDKSLWRVGLNISNMGNKISYLKGDHDYQNKDFIPTNLRLGSSFLIEKDKHSYSISFDLNKLLVPTSPIYYSDSTGINGNGIIYKGKDPHVRAFKGMIQSFYDAPNGFKEEMQEIYYGVGFEYWYNRLIAIRAGYFQEHENKGNQKNINLGAGFRYKFISFDVAYSIIPNKIRNEIDYGIQYQRNNIYLNLIFQINTKRTKTVKE